MSSFLDLETEEDLESALACDLAVLYKHSPLCGLSTMAQVEMSHFSQGNEDVPIYMVDVIRDRALSQAIAERFEIEHESPQIIVLRRGRAVFDASHRGVSAHALERELDRFPAA